MRCKLRYIKFNTFKLGEVVIEIMFIPHRKDLINSITIHSPALLMNNAKGAWVNKRSIKALTNLL